MKSQRPLISISEETLLMLKASAKAQNKATSQYLAELLLRGYQHQVSSHFQVS